MEDHDSFITHNAELRKATYSIFESMGLFRLADKVLTCVVSVIEKIRSG